MRMVGIATIVKHFSKLPNPLHDLVLHCLFWSLHYQVVYDQKVLGKFCGQENSTYHPGKQPILSQGNRLTLIFQTSNSTSELQQHIGFSATYKAIGEGF